jgi:hypothetical protein
MVEIDDKNHSDPQERETLETPTYQSRATLLLLAKEKNLHDR